MSNMIDGMCNIGPLVVAIPARDEVDRIGACLDALNNQSNARLDHIVLLVNNTLDDTAACARTFPMHPATILHIFERTLPPEQANAGYARGLAMQEAARLAGCNGVLLTTDADTLVDSDWLASNLAALRAGAEVVAGWVELEPGDWGRIPQRLHEDDARECAYDALCDELHARLDPDPYDPWPRHTQHSGASIAVTANAYRRCGGVPRVSSGEDRALIAALRAVDARIRHAPEVHVMVSGRLVGRATGGMAETISRRLIVPDVVLDERLEPAAICALRAAARAELRALFVGTERNARPLARMLGVADATMTDALAKPYFGQAWQTIEAISPALVRRPVPVDRIAAEMANASSLLAPLRDGQEVHTGQYFVNAIA